MEGRVILPVLFGVLVLGLIGFSPYVTAQEETTLPDWFENNHTWLDNKQIDDELFLQAMQYLIDNDLIKTQKDSMTHKFVSTANNVISKNNFNGAEHFVHFAADSNFSGCEKTNSCLVPYTITINVGDSVTWNTEYGSNTISAGDLFTDPPTPVGLDYPNGFYSGFMQIHTTFTHQFDTEGTYPYFSFIRPWASGIVIVEPNIDPSPDDHYLGYDVKETKGTPKFVPLTVELRDQFGDATYIVKKPKMLYNPVEKQVVNADGTVEITPIQDPVTHFKGYQIKTPKGDPKFVPVSDIRVSNQFGTINVDATKPDLLLVPTAKSHDDPNVPELDSPAVDHYKCYKVKLNSDFVPLQVRLFDPNFDLEKLFDVKKPKLLCNPVEKTLLNPDGTPSEITSIQNPENHLMCYDLKKMKDDPKFEKRNVFTNNQFGADDLEVKKQKQLCVPSIKTLL
jgi:plastocyanin